MIAKQKQHIRAKKKTQRENLAKEEADIRSRQIVYAFLEEFDLNGKKVLTYLPKENSNEVDTWFLVTELFDSNETEIYVPAFDAEKKIITTKKINKNTEYYSDKFSIPTPKNNMELDDINIEDGIEFDYIITPLIAFDLSGNRLGHGFGAYDKFLSAQPEKALKIGFAYEIQLVQKGIPADDKDVKLDYCITEDKIYKF